MTDEAQAPTPAAATAKPKTAPRKRAAQPINARGMALLVSKRVGHSVTPKQVRQWARDNVTRFGDDRYTVHAYSGGEQSAIMAGFVSRNARRTASKAGDK